MTRRGVPREAATWLTMAIPLVMLLALAGCRRLPVRQLDPDLDPRVAGPVRLSESEALAANIVTEPIAHAPALPPLPSRQGRPAEPYRTARSTPFLDKALERAQALQKAAADPPRAQELLPITRADDSGSETVSLPGESPAILEPPAPFIVPARLAGPSTELSPDASRAIETNGHVNTAADASIPGDVIEDAGNDPSKSPPPPAREMGPSESSPRDESGQGATLNPGTDWKEQLAALRDHAKREAERGGERAEDWKDQADLLDEIIHEALTGGESELPSMASVLALLAESPAMVEREPGDDKPAEDDAATVAESRSDGSLSVGTLEFCREVRGYGDIVAEPSSRFLPGQVVILYCEMNGIQYEPVNSDYRSLLATTVELVTPDGRTPVWSRTLGVAEDVCRRPRRDYYVSYQFALPSAEKVAPGPYRLVLRQVDRVSRQSCEGERPIVLGRP